LYITEKLSKSNSQSSRAAAASMQVSKFVCWRAAVLLPFLLANRLLSTLFDIQMLVIFMGLSSHLWFTCGGKNNPM